MANAANGLIFLGGSGLLALGLDRWGRRGRVHVRVISIGSEFLDLEIENRSTEPNSLQADVLIEGVDYFAGGHVFGGRIEGDRSLPPFTPREIRCRLAKSDLTIGAMDGFTFLDLIRVRVQPTRGGRVVVRIPKRLEPHRTVSRWRYFLALVGAVVQRRRRNRRLRADFERTIKAAGDGGDGA